MLNCNLIIFSFFLAFMTVCILAFADDASGMQMAHRSSASVLCSPRIVAQIK